MFILILTLIAFIPINFDNCIKDEVDVIEINEYRGSWKQIIFLEWHPQLRRHSVVDWRMYKSENMHPVKQGNGYLMRWHDGDLFREVWAPSRRFTYTQHDPELLDRNVIPQEQRRGLKNK
jgi:hypothetical protein